MAVTKAALTAVAVVCIAAPPRSRAQGQDDDIRTSMPPALKELEAKLGRAMDYSMKSATTDKRSRETISAAESKLLFIDKSVVQERRSHAKSAQGGTSAVSGMNPRYAFQLEANKAKTGWLLTDFRPAAGSAGVPDHVSDVLKHHEYLTKGCSRLTAIGVAIYLPELFALPNYKTQSVSRQGDDLTLNFSYADPKSAVATTATTTFCTAKHWLPTRWSQVATIAGVKHELSAVREVTATTDGYEFDLVLTKKSASNGDNQETQAASRYHLKWPSRIDDSLFKTTAYGIPEPIEPESPWLPFYGWVLVAAIVLLVAAVCFRSLARRRAPN